MPVMSDRWIRRMAAEHGMIDPFSDRQVKEGVISFGVSSYGYDIRLSNEFKVVREGQCVAAIDPKAFDSSIVADYKGDSCVIPAHSFVLGKSIEYFRIPRNILTICFGKSTYARCGVVVNVTPFEPEWEGSVTMAISNTAPYPVRIYANEGIAQAIFIEAREACEISYADRKGKYQSQKEITPAKLS